MATKELRINDRIQAPQVRLIGEAGEQLGIQPIEEALRLSGEAGLDLVLVSPEADPPVAKIIDYGKYKYEQRKRQQEHHHHAPQIKELRLRPKTEEHDLLVRAKQARGFIERGDRVIVNVFFPPHRRRTRHDRQRSRDPPARCCWRPLRGCRPCNRARHASRP